MSKWSYRFPDMDTIRVVIADDHALFRAGLNSLLRLHPDIEVVAQIEKSGDIEAAIANTGCDVLLLDLQMDRWTTRDIEKLSQMTKVVVVTASERREDATAALKMGARAIVQKRFAVETLIDAIRRVAEGFICIPPSLRAEFSTDQVANSSELSSRESEIVRWVAIGMRNAEIAQRLSIAESTVKTHLNNIFQKLGIRDRVELTLYAIRVGLAQVEQS